MKQHLKQFSKAVLSMPALAYIGVVTAIGLVARLMYLTKADLWHDEGYTAMIVNLPPGEIIAATASDVHPPLYYLLLHYWQLLFGSSEAMLRGFSVICGLATIVLLYFLLRKLFSEKVARLGLFLAAIGPFLVRYSEEARPFALATLIAVAATYLFVLAMKHKKLWLWSLYGLAIAAGLYTQYYLALLVPVHLVYGWCMLGGNKKSFAKLFKQPGLWLSGAVCVAVFLPWLSTLVAQVTRISGGFWIPPVDWFTIPNTLSSFLTYSWGVTAWLGVTFTLALIWLALRLAKKQPKQKAAIWLLLAWTFLPMLIIALLSLNRPVFVDRYFTFVAPAFYALLAVLIVNATVWCEKWWVQPALVLSTSVLCVIGIGNVGNAAWHQMGTIGTVVDNGYQSGDTIISAELYTFFDFSYYNQTGAPVYLLASDGFGEYGEWSLLEGKQHLEVTSLDSVQANRVWLVGKTGEKDYYETDTPKHWQLIDTHQAGDSAVRLYQLSGN